MSTIEAAVAALTERISAFLRPPSGDIQYLRSWSCGEFEVAIEPRAGVNIWMSDRRRPTGGEFTGRASLTRDARAHRLHSLLRGLPHALGGPRHWSSDGMRPSAPQEERAGTA